MLAEQTPARYIAFDLLARDDETLLDRPYAERRRALEELADGGFDVTPSTRDRGQAEPWLRSGEGVVAKEIGAPYRPGQRVGMVKVKRVRTIDAVVAGYRPGKEDGTVGSLILGLYDDDRPSCTSSATPRGCGPRRSGRSSAGSPRTRPASAATAIRAAGRTRRSSSGSSCAPSWSSRSPSTTPAAAASATGRRSCAGARTRRRPSAGSSRCSRELQPRLPVPWRSRASRPRSSSRPTRSRARSPRPQVAAAIGRGLEAAGHEVDLCPVADGGEGTLEALAPALGAGARERHRRPTRSAARSRRSSRSAMASAWSRWRRRAGSGWSPRPSATRSRRPRSAPGS